MFEYKDLKVPEEIDKDEAIWMAVCGSLSRLSAIEEHPGEEGFDSAIEHFVDYFEEHYEPDETMSERHFIDVSYSTGTVSLGDLALDEDWEDRFSDEFGQGFYSELDWDELQQIRVSIADAKRLLAKHYWHHLGSVYLEIVIGYVWDKDMEEARVSDWAVVKQMSWQEYRDATKRGE